MGPMLAPGTLLLGYRCGWPGVKIQNLAYLHNEIEPQVPFSTWHRWQEFKTNPSKYDAIWPVQDYVTCPREIWEESLPGLDQSVTIVASQDCRIQNPAYLHNQIEL